MPEEAGALGLGLFEAVVVMEEAGRTLASGPLAEALIAARLLAQLGGAEDLLGRVIPGEAIATIAMRDVAEFPRQWVAGGLVADAVVARKGNDVVLFMKGTAQFPQCGFSGRAVSLLKQAGANNLVTVNVLDDDEVRQAIKDFSNWPTIPQLYVKGEFVGGSDIMAEMAQSGELQKLLSGLPQQQG